MNASEIKFFKAVNSYIESMVEEWDSDKFKEVFEQHLPRLVRKDKKENSGDKVKKPKSVFMCFSTDPEIREKVNKKVKKDNPEAKVTQIASEIGKLWKSSEYRKYSDEGKFVDASTGKTFDYRMNKVKKWFDMAANDKKRYEDEMSERGLELPKPKEKKESTRPKTAYNLFCTENRPKLRDHYKKKLSGKDLTQKVGLKLKETWESYKDRDTDKPTQKDKTGKFEYTEEAERWIEMAVSDKKRFDKLKKKKEEEERKSSHEEDENNGFEDEDYYSDYEEDYEIQRYEEVEYKVQGSYIKVKF
jgi:high mobility group protein B2